MSQYLTKEEIRQWRSSLEKITLEEYARRLGKVLEEEKHTSDIIDIVMQNEKRLQTAKENSNINIKPVVKQTQNVQTQEVKKEPTKETKVVNIETSSKEDTLEYAKSKLTCKKPLTEREDLVLAHFVKNRGKIVYARDLAAILNLPCDYVYKYIKNLRTKISQDILQNAVKGGYIFDYR